VETRHDVLFRGEILYDEKLLMEEQAEDEKASQRRQSKP
jgi:hypothetical protein